MSKWKCEICGKEFDNFHAQGFDNKIYCPLCYFKKENQELKLELSGYRQAILEDKDMLGLKEESQKQKEVIDKAINNSQYWIDYYTRLNSDERIALRLQENIDILKEVE